MEKLGEQKKTKYRCTACGYRFTRALALESFNRVCPFCGKARVIVDTESSAQNILESATQMRFSDE